jgi:hypothetical protein
MHRVLLATTPHFAPTPGASSSRGKRPPVTRGAATAWSECVCACRGRGAAAPPQQRRLEDFEDSLSPLFSVGPGWTLLLVRGACCVSGSPIPVQKRESFWENNTSKGRGMRNVEARRMSALSLGAFSLARAVPSVRRVAHRRVWGFAGEGEQGEQACISTTPPETFSLLLFSIRS